ncbi:MAG: hypothetical protein V4622_00635 [Bacteroidota bacterium]
MKIFLAIASISCFLAKDIASFSWQTWFYVNQSEIAQEKCENKAKPMMHCDGKCYLSKQLKKLEQKEQQHNSKSNPFKNSEKNQYIVKNEASTLFQFTDSKQVENSFYYSEFFSAGKTTEILRPPIV